MDTKQKAIILLSPYYLENPDHKVKLIDYCRNSFDLIKIIQVKTKPNFKVLNKLIKIAISWKSNITVITDKDNFDLSTNMHICTVLGTLSSAQIANILLYDRSYTKDKEIRFKFIIGKEHQGLHHAIYHYRAIIARMKEQENKLSKIRQAVILMHQPCWYGNRELQYKLTDLCSENDLSIIKIIKSKNEYDANVFYRLINIINQEYRPITVIMEEKEYRSVDNILPCSIVGALILFGVIDFAVYREDAFGKLQLEFIKANDIDFLQLAQKHILQLVTFIQQKEKIS